MSSYCTSGKATVTINYPTGTSENKVSLNSPTTVEVKSRTYYDLTKLTTGKRYDVEVTCDFWQKGATAQLAKKLFFVNCKNPRIASAYCSQSNFLDFWVSPPSWQTNGGFVVLQCTVADGLETAAFNGINCYYQSYGAMQGLRNFSVTKLTPKDETSLPTGVLATKYWIEISNAINGLVYTSPEFDSNITYSVVCNSECPAGYCKIDCPSFPDGFCCLKIENIDRLSTQLQA